MLGLELTGRAAPNAAGTAHREGATLAVQGLTITDEELVVRSVNGDVDSFNQLIRRWERPIYALAYRTIGREDDARDVCQETFLRAFRALKGFKGQAKFSSWLYRIALNLCRDWMRRQRRTPVVQMPEDVDIAELAAAAGAGRVDRRRWWRAASWDGRWRRRWRRCPTSSARPSS